MKYKHLIDQMTLEEKASLMSGADFWHTKAVERLGIPKMMLTDGPHGLRKQATDPKHLGIFNSVPATCYPTAAGLANTWDEDLLEEMGRHLGLEAASEGVGVLLGPGCNIKRSPLCGRNFEYFSEDPYLSGKMAAALIRGVQENGISACVKHFAANSQELHRMTNDSLVDERTLREIYLTAFEMAVKEGGVRCLMTSYNRVNGTYANENPHLLKDILYGEWGYQGMVVSDWGGNNDRVASLKVGGTLEMPAAKGQTDKHIVKAVRTGELDEAVLDVQVDKILDMVLSTREHIQGKSYDKNAHHALAAKIAEKCAVLLKNEENILPFGKESVAVIGDFAETPRYQGAGSSRIAPTILENGLDALKREGVQVTGFARGFRRDGKADRMLLRQACNLAAKADKVLVWMGLDEGGEAENLDRPHMLLPENQITLLKALAEVNPNIVVVLSCGCTVETPWDSMAKAVLHGYLGGQNGATAVARLLTGAVSPSGHLAETMTHRYEDVPSANWFPGPGAYVQYREGLFVGYRYFDTAKKDVKYPFGHGLSYTSFEYSDLEVAEDHVSFRVKNVGDMAGEEVAQLYVAPQTGGMFRPAQELKGFTRVALEPGEEKTVEIALCDRSFAVWSIAENGWVIEPGLYDIRIGSSSRDIRLIGSITKTGEAVVNPYTDPVFAPYYGGDAPNIPAAAFAALLGREIPSENRGKNPIIGFNDPLSMGKELSGGVGRLIAEVMDLAYKTLWFMGLRLRANDLMFVTHMPWRNIGRMFDILNEEQVYALLDVINRKKGSWSKFLKAMMTK